MSKTVVITFRFVAKLIPEFISIDRNKERARLVAFLPILLTTLFLSTQASGQAILAPSNFHPQKGSSITLSSPDVLAPGMLELIEKKVVEFNNDRVQKDANHESKLSLHVGVVRLRGYIRSRVTPEGVAFINGLNKLFQKESSLALPLQEELIKTGVRENSAEMKQMMLQAEKGLLKKLDDFQLSEGRTERASYLVTILEYLDPTDNKIYRVERYATSFEGKKLGLLRDNLKQRITETNRDMPADDAGSRSFIAYQGLFQTIKTLNELYDQLDTDYKICGKTPSEWEKESGVSPGNQQNLANEIAKQVDQPEDFFELLSYRSDVKRSKNLFPDPYLFGTLKERTTLFDREILPDLLNGLNAPQKCDYEIFVTYKVTPHYIPEDKRGQFAKEVYNKSRKFAGSNKVILFVVPYTVCSGSVTSNVERTSTIYMPGVYAPDPEMNNSMNAALLRWANDFEKGFREAISYIPHDVEVHYAEIQLQGDYVYSGLKTVKRATGQIAQDIARVYITEDSRFDVIMTAYGRAKDQCGQEPELIPPPPSIGDNPGAFYYLEYIKSRCMIPKLAQILSAARTMDKTGIRVIDLSITNNLIRSKLTEEVVRKLIQSYISQRLPVNANIKRNKIELGEDGTGIDKEYFYNNKSPLPETTGFDKAVYTIAEIGMYIPIPIVNNIIGTAGTLYALHAGHDDKATYFVGSVAMPYIIGPILRGAFTGGKYLVSKIDGTFVWLETKTPSLFRSAEQTSQYLESLLQPRVYAVVAKQNDKAFARVVEEACDLDVRTMVGVEEETIEGFLKSSLPKTADDLLAYIRLNTKTINNGSLPAVISLGTDLIGEAGKRLPVNTGALDVLFHLNTSGQITMTLHDGSIRTLPIVEFIEQLGAIKAFQEAIVVRLGSCTEGQYLNEVARRVSLQYPGKKFLALVSEKPAVTGVTLNGEMVVLQGGKVTEDVFVKGKGVTGRAIRHATDVELAQDIIPLGKEIKVVAARSGSTSIEIIEGSKVIAPLDENLVGIKGTIEQNALRQLVVRTQIEGRGSVDMTIVDLMDVVLQVISAPREPVNFLLLDIGKKDYGQEFLRRVNEQFIKIGIYPPSIKVNAQPLGVSEIKLASIPTLEIHNRVTDALEIETFKSKGLTPDSPADPSHINIYHKGYHAILAQGRVNKAIGVCSLIINSKTIDNENPRISGRDVFYTLFEQLEQEFGKITGISSTWASMLPDNLISFNKSYKKIVDEKFAELLKQGKSITPEMEKAIQERSAYEAAWDSFTGIMAREKGIQYVTQVIGKPVNGQYDAVNILFSNTPGPYSRMFQSLSPQIVKAIELVQKKFTSAHPIELQRYKEILQRKISEVSTREGLDYGLLINTHNNAERWVELAYQDMVQYGAKDFDFSTFVAKMKLIEKNRTTLDIFNRIVFEPEGAYKTPGKMKELLESSFVDLDLRSNELIHTGLSPEAAERAWLLTKNQKTTLGNHIGFIRYDLRLEETLNSITDVAKKKEIVSYLNGNIDRISEVYSEMNRLALNAVNFEILSIKLQIFDLFNKNPLSIEQFDNKFFEPLGAYKNPPAYYRGVFRELKTLNKSEFEYLSKNFQLLDHVIELWEKYKLPIKIFASPLFGPNDAKPGAIEKIQTALTFYDKQNIQNISGHLDAINFDYPVTIKTLTKGTSLFRYSTVGSTEAKQYFVLDEAITPEQVRDKWVGEIYKEKFVLTKSLEVLESSTDTNKMNDRVITQIFSSQIEGAASSVTIPYPPMLPIREKLAAILGSNADNSLKEYVKTLATSNNDPEKLSDFLGLRKIESSTASSGNQYLPSLENKLYDQDFSQTPILGVRKPVMLNALTRQPYKLKVAQGELLIGSSPIPEARRLIFVMDRNGEIYVADEFAEIQKISHSSFLSGEFARDEPHIVVAGELYVKNGKLSVINRSGHYPAKFELLFELIRELAARGYDIRNIITVEHQPYPRKPNSPF